ncbi:MAG: alpha-glucan family phosphorylase [Pseudomonadota bacterium]|nr:alpha-glucan family phosphorylase [Pseudomonadota bacterium]
MPLPGTAYYIEVHPSIPPELARLPELANNLWYSWDRPTRELFARLHPELWESVGQSPKAFLRRIDEDRLRVAADDDDFMRGYRRVLSSFDSYHQSSAQREATSLPGPHDLVAYFCAEFGFHESLPIYSGGLGILAGDHCKAASDLHLPLVGIGLLYRQGYFQQTLDGDGNQEAAYSDSNFSELPIEAACDAAGAALHVQVPLAGREVKVRVWRAKVAHVILYLLDTDLPENGEPDRRITHRLYGGDQQVRLEQEIVLGVGGVRALQALGVTPTVWHINEGHAAFMILERMRAVVRSGLTFAEALEAVAANTLFTTHTAVPAGHDHFAAETIVAYFEDYCRTLSLAPETLAAIGQMPGGHAFNMTALALRGSRFHNGVSRIHGEVSAGMLQHLWPQVPANENPIDYVTNAVHSRTFMATEWADMFDRFIGHGWMQRLSQGDARAEIDCIPDHLFWSVHQYLKSRMLQVVQQRVRAQHFRNQGSEAHLDRILRFADPADPHVLTIGFARRFATYKRAGLLFDDLDWLRQIVTDAQRPVLLVFAGRAHPADVPGQDIIRRIASIARMREFEGRILLVEGYDLRLARRLVAGVDVWLNNPVYPLEASGTSGMKAGMNGVINLSVLDGWWGEAYAGDNGWAIKPANAAADPAKRDAEESRTLYELLQDHVLPMYYDRAAGGYSPAWIRMAKRSIATILPRFRAGRMVEDYIQKFYAPAARAHRTFSDNDYAVARDVAHWKERVRAAWPGVRAQRTDLPIGTIPYGQALTLEVTIFLNGLTPADLRVELMVFPSAVKGQRETAHLPFALRDGPTDPDTAKWSLQFRPDRCGGIDYRIRVFPSRPELVHALETGLLLWL